MVGEVSNATSTKFDALAGSYAVTGKVVLGYQTGPRPLDERAVWNTYGTAVFLLGSRVLGDNCG